MKPVAWTACLDCGQRVTSDSIHTCSPQLKTLTDEEIYELFESSYFPVNVKNSDLSFPRLDPIYFARAILRKAQEK
jgi:hypothetical protein